MTNKIIVAKPGIDALTEKKIDNFSFHSDYDTLKYHATVDHVVTVDWSKYYNSVSCIFSTYYQHRHVETIPHGLDYPPFFIAYWQNFLGAGTATQLPFQFGDACFVTLWDAYIDSTNLYFVGGFQNGANSGTSDYTMRYRLFRNDLGL